MKLFHHIAAAILAVSLIGTATAAQAPQEIVQTTTDQVVSQVKADKDALRADPGRMYRLVSEKIFPHFDFAIMSQWVLGPTWKGASPAQREAFSEQFRKLLVRTYATALLEYSDQQFEYPPAADAAEKPNTAMVKQLIHSPGGDTLPVTYRLHNKSGDWKVFDVAVDGVSLIKTYKGSFAPIISEKGLGGLLENMTAKNQELNK